MALHDAAWHDAQYNNRARVPEAATVLLPRWAAASALALVLTLLIREVRHVAPDDVVTDEPCAAVSAASGATR